MKTFILAFAICSCAETQAVPDPEPTPAATAVQSLPEAPDAGSSVPPPVFIPEHHEVSGNPVQYLDAGACLLPVREQGECDCRPKHRGAVCADECHHDNSGELIVHAFCIDGGVP